MKKAAFVVLLIFAVFALSGCSAIKNAVMNVKHAFGIYDYEDFIEDDSKPDPVEETGVTSFSYFNGGGMMMNSGCNYDAVLEDGKAKLKIRAEGISDEDALMCEEDAAFMDRLSEIVKKHGMGKWNGFSKSDTGVLDGSSFSLSVLMDNGKSISAHGYMVYPDGYRDAAAEIDALFMEVYESYRPDRAKALERYYEDVIAKERGELERTDIEYPYIAEGGADYSYGKYDGGEGVVMHLVTDIDDDGADDMIVIYHEKGELDGEECFQLSFEVYSADENAQVRLAGGGLLDDSLYWNDSLYADVFLHNMPYSNKRIIGYCAEYSYKASVRKNKIINIKLYDYENGEVKELCDEWQSGPIDRDSWTYEELSNFTDLAEKYGFYESLSKWKEMPGDPVLYVSDMQRLAAISTSTNYGSGFYEALTASEAGKAVEGFAVSGTITKMY